MSDDEFRQNIEGLATKRLEKPKTLTAQAMQYWSEIRTHMYHFDRGLWMNCCTMKKYMIADEFEVSDLRTIGKAEILKHFDELLQYGSNERKKLAVYVYSAECVKEADSVIEDAFKQLRIVDDENAQVSMF
jgi:insulysin